MKYILGLLLGIVTIAFAISPSEEVSKKNIPTEVVAEKATNTPTPVIENPVIKPKTVPIKVKAIETPTVVNNCDSNYSGCVPIASDVDCAGGKGNGPVYVRGPVRVIGSDIYDLDRDNDGYGCE